MHPKLKPAFLLFSVLVFLAGIFAWRATSPSGRPSLANPARFGALIESTLKRVTTSQNIFCLLTLLAFIFVSPTVPTESQWGFDATGSPNWDRVLAKRFSQGEPTEYYPAALAKQFRKAGCTVVGAELSITKY